MHIRVQKRRLPLDPVSVVSPEAVVRMAKQHSAWPKSPMFLEWRDGCYEEIRSMQELQLASRLVSEYHYLSGADDDNLRCILETARLERKCAVHMADPAESESEPEPTVEEDITLDDYVQWGCRNVLEDH